MKSTEGKIPSNLKKYETVIIVRNFEDWRKTIIGSPKGYDDYAQKKMFKDYTEAIENLELLFKERGIKYSKKIFIENFKIDSGDYVFDYKLNCTGGVKESDWWMCSGGFFFKDLKSGKEYELIGTDKGIIKQIRKKIKSNN